MCPGSHQSADLGESFEISLLAGDQRVGLEERYDAPDEIVEAAHFVLERLIASIRSNTAASEMLLHQQKHLAAISVLLTEKLGLTSQPTSSLLRGEKETVKQPSPSTNPAK
jgi:hypothetical protein